MWKQTFNGLNRLSDVQVTIENPYLNHFFHEFNDRYTATMKGLISITKEHQNSHFIFGTNIQMQIYFNIFKFIKSKNAKSIKSEVF